MTLKDALIRTLLVGEIAVGLVGTVVLISGAGTRAGSPAQSRRLQPSRSNRGNGP